MEQDALEYKSITANGLNIHYIENGIGQALILLHGGSVNAEINWKVNLEIFAVHYRCIAVDCRGQGRTANPSSEYSYSLMADDISSLIQVLKLENPIVCGWSDGGQIALELGINHSKIVKGLVVGGALMNNTMPTESWTALGFNGPGDVDFDKLKRVEPNFYAMLEEAHKSQGPEYWKVLITDLTKMWFNDSSYPQDRVKLITTPTLIIQADHDDMIPISEALNLFQNIEGSKLAIIPGATHDLSMGGHSNVFTTIIIDFITRLNEIE